MAGISSIGVGSGLDLEGLIQNLLAAEAAPTTDRLNFKEATLQARISAFGSVKSVLSQFQSSLSALSDIDSLQSRSANSSDTSLFTATADNSAVEGSYSIQVLNLAKAQKLVSTDFSDPDATVGSGTLTIADSSSSFDVAVGAGTTLNELRQAINDAGSSFGVSASILTLGDGLGGTTSKLVISTDETGTDNAFTILVDDDDATDTDNAGLSRFFFDGNPGSQLTEVDQATNASITVDGFTSVSSTNVFANVISGVTVTAQREPDDPLNPATETLTIALNTAAVEANVKGFVESYNEVVTTLKSLTSFDPETGEAGPLNGDATIRNLLSQFRSILGDAVDGTVDIQRIAELGVRTARDGSVSIDGSILSAAIDENFADIGTLFASENGITNRLDALLTGYLEFGGILSTRTDGFNKQLARIEEQRNDLDQRLIKIEAQFRSRFAALDALVAQLQSSGDFLLAQLDNTASIIGKTPGGNNR